VSNGCELVSAPPSRAIKLFIGQVGRGGISAKPLRRACSMPLGGRSALVGDDWEGCESASGGLKGEVRPPLLLSTEISRRCQFTLDRRLRTSPAFGLWPLDSLERSALLGDGRSDVDVVLATGARSRDGPTGS
jgi:hypothetical protein